MLARAEPAGAAERLLVQNDIDGASLALTTARAEHALRHGRARFRR